MSKQTWQERYNEMIAVEAARLIVEVQKNAAAGIVHRQIALCYKRVVDKEWGEIHMIPLDPGWAKKEKGDLIGGYIFTGECMGCGVAYSNYSTWIKQRTDRLPILGA